MDKSDNVELWQALADALNALEDAGYSVQFGDRKGPETNWWTAPHAYAGNRASGTEAAWSRKRSRWIVEQR
ncbi:hypothetical protein ACMA1D_18150 [Streptomyces sp. 796.1]|uniref:hypothetical protein n=1 Tax=Streptomyces sp. 796.1 TaxID=3163029 RepID=UPI0039C9CAC5